MLTCTFLELVKGSVINVVIIITGLITTALRVFQFLTPRLSAP